MITLYGNPISGHSHRVTAMLTVLQLDYEDKVMQLSQGEHKHADYLALNPLGKIPALTDANVVLRDSAAILVYLAKKYDQQNLWLPEDAVTQGQIQQWLSIAVNEISSGPGMLRIIKVFGLDMDPSAALATTNNIFDNVFEPHLSKQQ